MGRRCPGESLLKRHVRGRKKSGVAVRDRVTSSTAASVSFSTDRSKSTGTEFWCRAKETFVAKEQWICIYNVSSIKDLCFVLKWGMFK